MRDHQPHGARPTPYRLLALLAALSLLPAAVALLVPRSAEPTYRGEPRLLQRLSLNGVQFELAGADGSHVRVHAAALGVEAAETGALVTARKAPVAREVLILPADAQFPRWRFARLQIEANRGEYRWTGPATIEPRAGEELPLPRMRGSASVRAGRLEFAEADR